MKFDLLIWRRDEYETLKTMSCLNGKRIR